MKKYDYNHTISKQNRAIWIISLLLIISLCSNIYFRNISSKNSKMLTLYFNKMISNSEMHMIFALEHLDGIESCDDDYYKMRRLIEVSKELEAAGESIGDCSLYFTFMSKDNYSYGGNAHADSYFRVYSLVIDDWAKSIQHEDLEKIPTNEELKNLRSDIRMTRDKLVQLANNGNTVEDLKNYNFENLWELFNQLSDEVITKDIKRNLKEGYFK